MTWRDDLDERQLDEIAFSRVYVERFNHGTTGHNRLVLIDALARMLDQCEVPSEPEPVRLDVPWLSQLGKDAAYAPGDCGPAVLAMWLRFLGHDVTVDAVSAQSGLDRGFSYTMPAHLIWAARHWNRDLYWKRYLDLDVLRTEIDAGQPCIALVHYPSLLDKYDPNYSKGHWILITGYTDDSVFYNDPYWLDSHGKDIEISNDFFDAAWVNNKLDGNSERQALRMRR